MKKKITILAAAFVFAVGMLALTACGSSGPKITDAASLAAANKTAQEAAENYHMDMNMDMDMTVKMSGLEEIMGTDSLTVPMNIKMNMDSGKETAHAVTEAGMEMLGQSAQQKSEMYIDVANGVTYTKEENSDVWVKAESDSSMSEMMNSVAEMSTEILEKAEYSETEEEYVMTLDAGELGESIKEMDLFNSSSTAGMDMKEFNINEGTIIYTFYKDTALLKKIEMQGLDITAQGEMQGTAVDMQIKLTDTMDYSQYGEIDPSVYAIPEDVVNSAQ